MIAEQSAISRSIRPSISLLIVRVSKFYSNWILISNFEIKKGEVLSNLPIVIHRLLHHARFLLANEKSIVAIMVNAIIANTGS